jgi:hypothetical protein
LRTPQRIPAAVAVVSTTSKSWVIVAVLAIIADAEQYFSTDSAMATPQKRRHRYGKHAVGMISQRLVAHPARHRATVLIRHQGPNVDHPGASVFDALKLMAE